MAAPTPKRRTSATAKEHHGHGVQYAALPFRRRKPSKAASGRKDGLQILLVTSRDTGRWVIPKGWPMKGKRPHAAAAREALEEAGVTGKIGKLPLGAYRYQKRLKNGAALTCLVDVFPLQVQRQRKDWPERRQRTAHWFTPLDAAKAVDEPELAALIEAFAEWGAAAQPGLVVEPPGETGEA